MTNEHAGAASAQRVIALIDLTDLDDGHRPDGIEALVDDAVGQHVAAICVWPEFVGPIRRRLAGSELPKIATVVNFPAGTGSTHDVVGETGTALDDGADEIDMVLAYRSLMAGDEKTCRDQVAAVAETVHARGAVLKVIIESGELQTPDLIRAASRCSIEGGADFVKTSTGKTARGASLGAVDAMLDEIVRSDRTIGIKASGGIRTVADAVAYLDLVDRRMGPEWATPSTFRFGASGLLADAVGEL